MVIKAQSPANFAEEYIITSIWNNRFPPGSLLPSERELSELIGVTRTTLREVLQRLARDGWLTIQHGKSTRINNFWDTSGLNVLETLAHLEHESAPLLIDNLLSAYTSIASIFISRALHHHPEGVCKILREATQISTNSALDYTKLDYHIFQKLAFASGNPIYGLIVNGLKEFYLRVGQCYFISADARNMARNFYTNLLELANEHAKPHRIVKLVRTYGQRSSALWRKMQRNLLNSA